MAKHNPKTIIVEIVRAKAETLALIADGFAALETGGLLIIDGQKTDGIESILRLIKAEFPLAGVFSKSHGKTFGCIKTAIFCTRSRRLADASRPSPRCKRLVARCGAVQCR